MRRIAGAMAALYLLFETSFAAAAPLQDIEKIADDLIGVASVEPDVVSDLKARIGNDGLQKLASVIYSRTGHKDDPCLYSEAIMMLQANIDMALRSDTPDVWRENSARVVAVMTQFAATPSRTVTTRPGSPPTGARSLEYAARVARDQAWRARQQTLLNKTSWAQGLGVPAWAYLRRALEWKICAIDRENTFWLKADLAANGWPRISTAGAQTDHDAWLLAQHADTDPAFQIWVLGMMEPLVSLGETDPEKYAILRFRVLGPQSLRP